MYIAYETIKLMSRLGKRLAFSQYVLIELILCVFQNNLILNNIYIKWNNYGIKYMLGI